jgi:hypothetical protein
MISNMIRPICPVRVTGSKRGQEGDEANSTEDDLEVEIWKNAAKYCLNEVTIKTVLGWPDLKAQILYIHGLKNTALVCIRTDLPNSARFYGQHHVFCAGMRDMETTVAPGPGHD